MKKVFAIHGLKGSPNNNWLPWLMAELRTHNIYGSALTMIHSDKPDLDWWLAELERHVGMSHEDEVYLVGQSLGSAAILNFLQTTECENVKGVILVSGRIKKSSNPLTKEFYPDFNFDAIIKKAPNRVVIHGELDPLVSVDNAYELAEKLVIDPIIVPGAGHFISSEGCKEVPIVLEKLLEMINKQ